MALLTPETIDRLESILAPPRGGGRGKGASGRSPGPLALAQALSGAVTASAGLSGSRGHVRRSHATVATLKRLVARAPEVVVKVTGRQNGAGHVLANFTYIARTGWGDGRELGLETSEGAVLQSAEEMRRLAFEWQQWEDDGVGRRKGSTSLSLVLSMPAGTDPEALKAAALDFARDEMGDRRWTAALHDDCDHVHVHLTLARRNDEGRRFNPNRDDLFRYRQLFAEKLRSHGLEANATPRRARGVGRDAKPNAILKIAGRGGQSRAATTFRSEAVRLFKGQESETSLDATLRRDRGHVLEAYKAAALELASSPEAEAKRLAGQLARFAQEMPRAETRLSATLRAMREREASLGDKDVRARTSGDPRGRGEGRER